MRLKPSWSGLKTAATANLRLPMAPKNAPRFDVQGQLYRMTVDLTRDGVDGYTALKVLRDRYGYDEMAAKHFASWLGLSPNNRITGQSHQLQDQGLRQPGPAALRLAANALHRSDSALGAFLRRKKAHLGAQGRPRRQRAQASLRHLLHAAVRPGVRGRWRQILRKSVSAAGVAAAKRRAAQLGYQLVPMSDGKQQDTRLPLNPAAAAV